jgi:DNA-binding transcriptional MerR regulator
MTARPANRPVQEFFSIGEVCALTDLKPHVLRYWESQFRFLSPSKNRSGNRVYKSREVELILLVKHLLYTEKYTIDGARIRLESYRKNGELKVAARQAAGVETLSELRQAVDQVIAVLDGKLPAKPSPAEAAPVVASPGEEPGERGRGRRSSAKTGFQLSLEPDQP